MKYDQPILVQTVHLKDYKAAKKTFEHYNNINIRTSTALGIIAE